MSRLGFLILLFNYVFVWEDFPEKPVPSAGKETGIIVLVAYTRNQREILANLNQKGYKNFDNEFK